MDVFLVITQGAGLALACGVRPFLPVLLAGALAAANRGVDFGGTDFAFLEGPAFLAAVVAALIAVVAVERRRAGALDDGTLGAALAGVAVGLAALEFAGSLADEGHPAWPGLVGGVALALLAQAAVRRLFAGAARRLDREARGSLPVYADAASLALAAVAIALPPVSILALAFFVFLLVRGRRRDESKYAGLRILR
jgi:hypothetical protein